MTWKNECFVILPAQYSFKIVFDRHTEAPLYEFLSVVESLYPGLQQCFVRERYPHLSEKEYSVCFLSFAGLSIGEIGFLLNQSENSVYKARSAINRKIGHNFCSVLREDFEHGGPGHEIQKRNQKDICLLFGDK
jgi:DNA-binding CsgD family transcriptional regulator